MSAGATTGPVKWVAVVVVLLTALLGSCFERKPPLVLEYADVVDAATPGALVVSNFDGSLGETHVLAPTRFQVAAASVTPKAIDPPGIAYELTPGDAIRFREWTAARIKRPIAVMLDRRVVMMAVIQDPLPGKGTINFGPSDPGRGDLWEICDRLKSTD